MPVEIKITAETAEEAQRVLRQMAGAVVKDDMKEGPFDYKKAFLAAEAELNGLRTEPEEQPKPKTKRKRRTKAEIEADKAEEEAAAKEEKAEEPETEEPETATEPATIEEAKTALAELVGVKGFDAGGKLLQSEQFGVKRVSELDPSQYADLIAACKFEIEN